MIETKNVVSIDKLRQRERETFASFVNETSGHVYRVALKILGNAQDAEDVLQEAYLKAFRALPNFEGRSHLTTWLYRIAVNESLMVLRRRKVQTVSLEGNDEEGEIEPEGMDIVDFCCLPEGDLLSSEGRQFLDQAVQRLPTNLRIVFVMRDMEGLSIQDTSEALELSEGVVKTRLLRARLHLRQQLSVYYGGLLGEEIKR